MLDKKKISNKQYLNDVIQQDFSIFFSFNFNIICQKHIKYQNMNSYPFILIYMKFKGFGQIIRYLLRYLDVPFTQIFLDEYQTQKKTLSPEVRQALKGKSINKNEIPAIIHNNEIIYELNSIMTYICIVSNREDLLGHNIYQKAHVCQFLEIFSRKIRPNVMYIFRFIAQIQIGCLEGVDLLAFIDQKFNYLLKQSGYFLELSKYLKSQSNQQFLLGKLTIMDFFYIQVCRFALILFKNISVELARPSWQVHAVNYQLRQKKQGRTNQSCQVLKIMQNYQYYYQKQQFYQKDREYFDQFPYFPNIVDSESRREALKKLKAIDFLEALYQTDFNNLQ